MKKVPLLILSALFTIVSPVVAGEGEVALGTLTTVNGETFNEVKVLKHDPDGLMFRHAKGIAKIPFANLSEEVQKRYEYKPEAAAAFVKEHVDAEKEAKAKAAAARAEARERRAMQKAMELQMQLIRQQAAAAAGDGGYIIPGFADFGLPTHGYGLGYWPDLAPGQDGLLDLARRTYQWDRDRLFGDYSIRKNIGPNAPLSSGSVTHSNVRALSTFGGYRYPTDMAVLSGNPLIGNGRGLMGHRPSPRRFVPASSAGARVGGTGTLMQGGANRISHR